MEKMKDAVNAAAGGEGIPTRRIAGDAGREYILQTEEDTKAKAALEAGLVLHLWCCMSVMHPACNKPSLLQPDLFYLCKISSNLTTAEVQVNCCSAVVYQ